MESTEEGKDKHEEGKVTAETFVPDDNDIFIQVDENYERMIFGLPQEFKERELERIEEFDDYLMENKLRWPQGFDFREKYRFLMTSDYNKKVAYEAIMEYHNFVKENTPINMEGLDEYLQSGILYFCKRDKRFHPICIINVKKLIDTETDDETLTRYTLAVMGYAIEHAMRPGYIENWLVIVDFKDVGITQIPVTRLKTIVSQLKQNFRGRLFRLFGINVSVVLRTIWYLAKGMWDKYTQKKMILYGSDYQKGLLEYIDENCLEEKLGGNLANIEKDFYPPQFD